MAIYPILTPPARLNNISGMAYIKNGYIRKEYEITVFNSDTTERFHNVNITRYGPLKRWGIVLHAARVNFGSGAGDRPRRAAPSSAEQRRTICPTLVQNFAPCTPFWQNRAV
ncbi:hypothetical protein AB3X34_16455 [Raoultella terrigena]|jgi:hypothetical protein|uniref:hypothetical protein n=1 Tax=Raoultella terrigena TaxID=577 RepID=UPI00349F8985